MAWSTAKRKAGKGWDLLGPDLQEALVAKEALDIIGNQIVPKPEEAVTRLHEIIEYARQVLR
jgi:hypothetical protein